MQVEMWDIGKVRLCAQSQADLDSDWLLDEKLRHERVQRLVRFVSRLPDGELPFDPVAFEKWVKGRTAGDKDDDSPGKNGGEHAADGLCNARGQARPPGSPI